MFKRLVLASAALFAGWVVASAQEMKIEIKVPGYTEADVNMAIDQFRQNCRPLGAEFWGDVKLVEATLEEERAPYRQALGWKNSLMLRLSYSNAPQHGPAYASGTGVLAGHSFYYFLGGGSAPGYLAGKRSAQYLCGLSFHPKGNDVFVPVPALKFLDR